jgi:glycosyltransferase involved in cell wall biosynthesis
MKKVLIITYYWPPSGGAGVMRWLKMSKYLPEFGWQPIIFTPLNPDSGNTDFSLLKDVRKDIEVIKKPIWEPYNLYKWLTGKPKKSKFGAGYIIDMSNSSFFDRLSVFFRGNFMIPDPRLFWIRPSVRFLKKYLKSNRIDLIITTGPPHSMHLIGLGLRKKYSIPWLADFRDPWTKIAFYHKLGLTKWANKKHHKLEKSILKFADIITTVSPGCAEDIESLYPIKKVYVVYNGFDTEDYIFEDNTLDKEFSITHLGSLTSDRNPISLWKALGEINNENATFAEKLKIQLIGYTENTVVNSIKENGMSKNLEIIPSVSHDKGLLMLKKSQLLILPINISPFSQGILPGKMYEYLAVQRPIIAIGPKDGDFVKIINETKAGLAFGPEEEDKIKVAIMSYFDMFENNKLYIDSKEIFRFSRKNIVKQLIEIIESAI